MSTSDATSRETTAGNGEQDGERLPLHPHVRVLTGAMLAAFVIVARVVISDLVLRIRAGERVLLTAVPNVGKTWVALATALDVVARGGRVLLLVGEGALDRVVWRIQALARGCGLDLAAVGNRITVVHGAVALATAEGIHDLLALVRRVPPDLLLVDPNIAFFTGDENSAADAARHMGLIDRLLTDPGLGGRPCAVLVLHHQGKPSPHSAGGSPRGSSHFRAWADSHYSMERTGPNAATLKSDKQRDDATLEPRGVTILVDESAAVARVDVGPEASVEPAAGARPTVATRVLEVLLAAAEPLSVNDVKERAHCSGATARKVLDELGANGLAVMTPGRRGPRYAARRGE